MDSLYHDLLATPSAAHGVLSRPIGTGRASAHRSRSAEPSTPAMAFSSLCPVQATLRQPVGCVGVGLHGGQVVRLRLLPAPIGRGIVFRRTDLDPAVEIPARFDLVGDTRLCTVLVCPSRPEIRVGTIEHVMAALAGAGIDNAIVELDGQEMPILDGSSAPFLALIADAGVTIQSAPARVIEVLRRVSVVDGPSRASLSPAPDYGLDVSIDFEARAIGRQRLVIAALDRDSFRDELAMSRTFTLASEIESLRAHGLARGGSLDNALVVDGAAILNPGGLRREREFVRHKALDVVGDLALAGGRIAGRVTAHRPGHALNNALLRALFADRANWRLASAPAIHRAA